MRRKKVLITGAGGYIGSLVTSLFLKNFDVLALDNFSTGYREPLKLLKKKFEGHLKVIEADLRDNLDPLLKKEKPEGVVHFAGSCSVDESVKFPEKYFSNNVCASQNLLASMTKYGIKSLIFSSTCATYGEARYLPIDEKHPTVPTNPYGESKLIVEKMIEWYGRLKGLKYVNLRYFNVCGASNDGSLGDSKKPSVQLVQNAIRGALGIEPFYLTCPKVETPDGTPVRDYIDVSDLSEAHFAAFNYLSGVGGSVSEVINLGSGSGNSVFEIIKQVEDATDTKINFRRANTRKGEYASMIASNKKAKRLLGWRPKHTLFDSIKSLYLWYQTHPSGWNE